MEKLYKKINRIPRGSNTGVKKNEVTEVKQVQQEMSYLRALIEDDPTATQIGKHMEDPTLYREHV